VPAADGRDEYVAMVTSATTRSPVVEEKRASFTGAGTPTRALGT